ncbi:hypothetical protein EMIT0P74_70184 [Pseudomonas sp. IT-P74]
MGLGFWLRGRAVRLIQPKTCRSEPARDSGLTVDINIECTGLIASRLAPTLNTCGIKEQILLSDVIDAIASASLVAQFSVIASEGLRISCHRLRSASLCVAFGRWINSATACGYSLP